MAVKTDNSTVTQGSQARSVGSTSGRMQQAYRVANTQNVTPSVRHQRSPQADPNKFSQDLNSIANSIGLAAQDTYKLNDALVDELAADDTAMYVSSLDEIDAGLKNGEDRGNAIQQASVIRANLMAKKGDFDGDADMQARYREKFVTTSAVQAAAKIKKWQKEQYEIDYTKLKEEFDEYKTNIYPKLLAGVEGTGKDAIIKVANERIDKYINELAAYGEFSAATHRLDFARNMTSTFNAEVNGNITKYVGSQESSLVDVKTGKINKENIAKLWNDKFFYYGTMDDNLKITYRTQDASVNEEISKGLSGLIKSLEAGRSKAVEKHNDFFNMLSKAVSTPAVAKDYTFQNGNESFTIRAGYESNDENARKLVRESFRSAFGYYPTTDQMARLETLRMDSNLGDAEKIEIDRGLKNTNLPIDYTVVSEAEGKKLAHTRGNYIFGKYSEHINTINSEVAQPEEKRRAITQIAVIKDNLKSSAFAAENRAFMKNVAREIYDKPATEEGYNNYIKYRDFVESPAGFTYMNENAGSNGARIERSTYNAFYDAHEVSGSKEGFKLSGEEQLAIRQLSYGGVPKELSNYVHSSAFMDDAREASALLTPEQKEAQIKIWQIQKYIHPDEDIDFSKTAFNDKVKMPDQGVYVKVSSVSGRASGASHKIINQLHDGHGYYAENVERKVYDIVKHKLKKPHAANELVDNGMMLEDNGDGTFKVWQMQSEKTPLNTGIVVDLRDWEEGETLKEVHPINILAKAIKDKGFAPPSTL